MLEITVPASEMYDSVRGEFVSSKKTILLLEHSLLSISKWEMKTNRPLLKSLEDKSLTQNDLVEYIKCMTINKQSDDIVYYCLTFDNLKNVVDYMNLPMTATTISHRNKVMRGKSKIITSEVIYYWMISSGIPFECEKWHINRLLTLIEVCAIEGGGGQKMSRRETLMMYSELNAQRKAQLHTSG